jgi:hypothetical protein
MFASSRYRLGFGIYGIEVHNFVQIEFGSRPRDQMFFWKLTLELGPSYNFFFKIVFYSFFYKVQGI